MLNLASIEARLRTAQSILIAMNPFSIELATEVAALCDECEAFLTQARDVGLVSQAEESRADQIDVELNSVRSDLIASVPAHNDFETLRRHLRISSDVPQALKDLHVEYKLNYDRLADPHTRKSIEKYLRFESDPIKRRSVLNHFTAQIDDPSAFDVVLKILKQRGLSYQAKKLSTMYVKELPVVNRLIDRASRALRPHFNKINTTEPADFYFGLASKDNAKADAPFDEFRKRAFALLASHLKIHFVRSKKTSYHPENEVWEIEDTGGNTLGVLHLDSTTRENKYRGAWTQTALSRRLLPNGVTQIPLVFVGMSLENNRITFREARSFLHEMGHVLEHCLNRNAQYFASGINHLSQDMSEISSLYAESFASDPSLTDLFGPDYEAARQSSRLDKIHDLAMICLLSKIDLEIHGSEFRTADDLKKLIVSVSRDLDLAPPLIVPSFITIFDHAFSDEDYASTYYSYLLGFVFAQSLKSAAGTKAFDEFWEKTNPHLFDQTSLAETDFSRMIEDLC